MPSINQTRVQPGTGGVSFSNSTVPTGTSSSVSVSSPVSLAIQTPSTGIALYDSENQNGNALTLALRNLVAGSNITLANANGLITISATIDEGSSGATGPTGPAGASVTGPTGPAGATGPTGANYLNPGDGFLYNGPSDTNWEMGIELENFSTTIVGSATSLQIVIGTGSEGPDGFAIGQTGGSSIFELRSDDKMALFTGLVAVAGHTPASSSDTGITGTITWDSDYLYVCNATNTWTRVAISTW